MLVPFNQLFAECFRYQHVGNKQLDRHSYIICTLFFCMDIQKWFAKLHSSIMLDILDLPSPPSNSGKQRFSSEFPRLKMLVVNWLVRGVDPMDI